MPYQNAPQLGPQEGVRVFPDYFESLKKEMTVSADLLSSRLNKKVKYLAYPYGDTNPLVIALARNWGTGGRSR